MHKLFLHGGTLVLACQLTGCQVNTTPAPLRLETTPALSGSTQGLASDRLFAPFYATQQESATYRLTAIRAYARADPKADSSTLQFIYQGNQLVDKKLRRAGSSMLTDLPRKLTFDANNRLIASDATATTVASQTGVNGRKRRRPHGIHLRTGCADAGCSLHPVGRWCAYSGR